MPDLWSQRILKKIIGHIGVQDVKVKIIDKTNAARPTKREGFWAYKLNYSFEPHGLNLKDFV